MNQISDAHKEICRDLGVTLDIQATVYNGVPTNMYRAMKRLAVDDKDYEYANLYTEDTEHNRSMFLIEANMAFSRASDKVLSEMNCTDKPSVSDEE